MANGRGKKFSILKYFLMSSNAFGLMIGIFLVLFGMAYPGEKFPGGYTGKETAAIAGGFIFFTLIGYCGAHHQKIYALILYSVIILVFIGGNVVLWGVKPDLQLLDKESRTVYFVSGFFLILMVIGVVLSWQIRRFSITMAQCQAGNGTEGNSPNSPALEQMTSLTHHKINNNHPNHPNLLHPSSSTTFVQMITRPGGPGPHPQIPGSFQ